MENEELAALRATLLAAQRQPLAVKVRQARLSALLAAMPRQPRVEGFAALGGQLIVRDRPRSVALERLDDVITVVVLNQVAGLSRLEREGSIFELRALGAAAAREPAHIATLEPGRSVDRNLLGHIAEIGATRELGLGFPGRALVQLFDLPDVDLVLSACHLLLADNGLE